MYMYIPVGNLVPLGVSCKILFFTDVLKNERSSFSKFKYKFWFKIVLKVIFPSTHRVIFFRWPVAYFGSCTATAHQLYSTYWKCVDVLDENGLQWIMSWQMVLQQIEHSPICCLVLT